jgi:pimeloyl-ACP methyl ester carboxylesterase
MTYAPTTTNDTVATRFVDTIGGRYAYRRFGSTTGPHPPVVFTQHFMGNLDDFDPAITDGLAADREVILFDNLGVGASSGTVPETVEEMARDAERFLDALELDRVDLLGHSMGGLVAQELAIDRPDLVRRVVLVGTGPRGGEEIGSRPEWVGELFTRTYDRQEDMWLPILFDDSETSQAAGREFVERILVRQDRDQRPSAQSITAQLAAIHTYGAVDDPGFTHLSRLRQPTLVVNGIHDIIITAINSWLLVSHLPDAELVIYPDSGHGAHHQYHDRFVEHVRAFLDQ